MRILFLYAWLDLFSSLSPTTMHEIDLISKEVWTPNASVAVFHTSSCFTNKVFEPVEPLSLTI